MLELFFITSNRTKLIHARYLCRDYNVAISPQKYYGVGYSEPRILDREMLIEESIKDADRRWSKTVSSPYDKLFFIEDSSVIIHALSKEKEYPGLDIKYWIKETDFQSVDSMLKAVGNDRRVSVRSDITLRLQGAINNKDANKILYESFTSSVTGTITGREFAIATNPLYPWLDNRSFNKWFVPGGYNLPISMLPIAEADKCDFRAGAFIEMLRYLESRGLVERKREVSPHYRQEPLPLSHAYVFIVCGLPCAGKTTLGMYLTEKYKYYHIEASDFMYLSYYNHHGLGSSVSITDFAERVLREMPDIVVDQIIGYIKDLGNIATVITGFRSPREIEIFEEKYEGPLRVQSIYIDADFSIRFDRCIRRRRESDPISEEEFLRIDEQQLSMGLREMRKAPCLRTIENVRDINSYLGTFVDMFGLKTVEVAGQSEDIYKRPQRLEDAIVLTLVGNKEFIDKYLTTTEIAHGINKFFPESTLNTNKNNVSRYFNQNFYPYYEIKTEHGRNRYRLSHTGRSRALFLLEDQKVRRT